MIKNSYYIFSLIAIFASCSAGKKATITPTASTNSIQTKLLHQKDMSRFIEAENARLLGDKSALKLYTDYLVQNPKNPTAWYNASRICFQKRDISTALKFAQKAYELDEHNKYFQEFYTQLLVYDEKTKLAESQYNSLISKYPANEEYIYKKAMLYKKSKDYEKAVEAFTELEKKVGFNEDIILQKKNIYQRMGKTDLAIQELKKLRNADPSSPQYAIMMIDVYETGNQKERADEVYRDLEANFERDPMAQVALAQYYRENKNAVQYNRFMQQIMRNKNLDVETKISLLSPSIIKLETDSSEKGETIAMAKSIAEEYPDNKDALSLYAYVLYLNRQYDEALMQYQKYLQLDKSKIDVWNQVMALYMDKQQYDSVIYTSSKTLEFFPNNPKPYFFSGLAYILKKEGANAIKPLNKAIELQPTDPITLAQIYSSLGDVYHSLKNFIYSDSCFEKALKLQPDDATTLNNYAYYLSLRREKLDEAERMSKKSLVINPDSKSFLDTYGWILFQQKKYEEAKKYIELAIASGGADDGTLFDHLGDVYYHLNDISKAVELWKKAVDKGEDSPLLNKKINEGKWYEE